MATTIDPARAFRVSFQIQQDWVHLKLNLCKPKGKTLLSLVTLATGLSYYLLNTYEQLRIFPCA